MILLLTIIGIVLALFLLTILFGAPYVPSQRKDIDIAFDQLYKLSNSDVLLDIGSGDGVVLRAAAARGARAVGYEINPILVIVSTWLCRKQPLIRNKLANFWQVPFPEQTTVVYVFGESRDIRRMAERVEAESHRLAKPLKLISYGFEIPGKSAVKSVGAHHLYEFR